jgi:hypothetical protein
MRCQWESCQNHAKVCDEDHGHFCREHFDQVLKMKYRHPLVDILADIRSGSAAGQEQRCVIRLNQMNDGWQVLVNRNHPAKCMDSQAIFFEESYFVKNIDYYGKDDLSALIQNRSIPSRGAKV